MSPLISRLVLSNPVSPHFGAFVLRVFTVYLKPPGFFFIQKVLFCTRPHALSSSLAQTLSSDQKLIQYPNTPKLLGALVHFISHPLKLTSLPQFGLLMVKHPAITNAAGSTPSDDSFIPFTQQFVLP